ncbi:MAG: CopG family transcriptional regulator [Deltaproteobacteria bacterium]|nr:CopG family transcriptional regulator [Deltaproteobacteria bacterium]
MIRTQVSFNEKEYALAKKESDRLGVSLAEFLRRAIQPLLPVSKEKPWMRYAGFVESGNPLSSQQIDDLIYGQKD